MSERRRNPNQEELRTRRAEQEAQWNARWRQTQQNNPTAANAGGERPQHEPAASQGGEHKSTDRSGDHD
jgi:hypothetical protein